MSAVASVIALVLGLVAGATLRRMLRLGAALRHVTAERDRLSAELDHAYMAGAALSVDRGSAGVWRQRAELALQAADVADRQRIARACAAVAAHGAREIERAALRRAYTPRCGDLDAFFDRELSPEAAADFRDHLATCARCQRVLDGRMQESVAASARSEAGQ